MKIPTSSSFFLDNRIEIPHGDSGVVSCGVIYFETYPNGSNLRKPQQFWTGSKWKNLKLQ